MPTLFADKLGRKFPWLRQHVLPSRQRFGDVLLPQPSLSSVDRRLAWSCCSTLQPCKFTQAPDLQMESLVPVDAENPTPKGSCLRESFRNRFFAFLGVLFSFPVFVNLTCRELECVEF